MNMDMGGMSIGNGIPSLFTFQKMYTAIGIATVVKSAGSLLITASVSPRWVVVGRTLWILTVNVGLCDASNTPSKPKSLLWRTYATITATTREAANATWQPIHVGRYTLHLAPAGPVSLIVANLITILVMMFYGFNTLDRWSWENIGYRAGFMTICQLPLIFLLAGKQNIIGFLTGVGYERLNWYHRWVSRTLWLSATIHMGFWFRDYGQYDYIVTMLTTDQLTMRRMVYPHLYDHHVVCPGPTLELRGFRHPAYRHICRLSLHGVAACSRRSEDVDVDSSGAGVLRPLGAALGPCLRQLVDHAPILEKEGISVCQPSDLHSSAGKRDTRHHSGPGHQMEAGPTCLPRLSLNRAFPKPSVYHCLDTIRR